MLPSLDLLPADCPLPTAHFHLTARLRPLPCLCLRCDCHTSAHMCPTADATPAGSLQEGSHFDALSNLTSTTDYGALTKNKSMSNLLSHTISAPPAIDTAKRMSFDAGQLDRMTRSPIVSEHEHGLGASGLRRIRQQPPRQLPTQRSASLNVTPQPASRHPSDAVPPTPGSPTLAFGEDLTRFPSESLHSFSFATQSDEFIHNRQNVLKRSIDFMRDPWGGPPPIRALPTPRRSSAAISRCRA